MVARCLASYRLAKYLGNAAKGAYPVPFDELGTLAEPADKKILGFAQDVRRWLSDGEK